MNQNDNDQHKKKTKTEGEQEAKNAIKILLLLLLPFRQFGAIMRARQTLLSNAHENSDGNAMESAESHHHCLNLNRLSR